ncbi:patellin-3-like [Cynara cardunculus var. scolymus]|uniref:CRAL-TRIO domain-containing protein n=1 Tax=Cynara cardunculus var. scolymus TaxID=59895 RepID=A0A118JTE4_CYNCS|nr:patellin-3-like [Cynara cardunculus var. scolymus]KVH90714.1 CRAL-TRIO domain-containing protein [Cynara cardunculus var. scolymus]
MADEYPTTTTAAAPEGVVIQSPPLTSTSEGNLETPPPVSVTDKETPLSLPLILTEKDTAVSPPSSTTNTTLADVIEQPEKPTKKVPESMVSFKEESNRIKDLSDLEKVSLDEFKHLVQEAITNKDFNFSLTSEEPTSEIKSNPEEISIWGIPLLKDERTDVILLKFLRARDFKVKDSFTMLKNTLRWRKSFSIDALVDENLGDDLEKVVFMHGYDKEGHPVCYNVYGEFQNKELYQKTFSDEEKRTRFLKWRIQFLERSIRKLDFWPGGINTIFQVSDLKNSPGPAKRELRLATKQALQLLQDNYPEFVAKQVFINVPWWYLAFYTMMSPFMTQRTKSKFVFASPARTAEALFKYVSPEHVPIQYGGLSVDYCDCNPQFTIDDPAAVVTVKPATKQTVEIIVNEKCTFVWELRVVGWEVSYSAEYVPNNESNYTIIIQKARKVTPTDEPVISHSFKINELGKILLTIDNPTSKKKKLLYRFKVDPLSE